MGVCLMYSHKTLTLFSKIWQRTTGRTRLEVQSSMPVIPTAIQWGKKEIGTILRKQKGNADFAVESHR